MQAVRETFNNNGKEICGFDVIEVQTNGEEVKKQSFTRYGEQQADQLVRELDDQYGHTGVYYFVLVRRYA